MTNDGWQDLKARFENHLSAEKNLAALTIRNYSTDLRPLTEFMEERSIDHHRELDRNMLPPKILNVGLPPRVWFLEAWETCFH